MSSSNATNIILNKTQKNIGIITSNIARADTMDEDVSLLDAIEQNENLTREDKDLIDTLEQLIIEDEYLDINQAKRALRTIKINYNVEKPIGVADSTKARYNEGTNIIDVYESSETINKDLLRHEIVHSIYVNIFTKFLPDYFSEGMTELLINEYVSELHYDEKTTYPFEVTMVKVLCEMVGSDNVRKTFAKGNMKTIERKVEDIAGTQKTKDFFKTVENIFEKYESGIKISDDEYNKMMNFLDSYFTYTYQEDKDEEKYERYLYYRGILSLINKSIINCEAFPCFTPLVIDSFIVLYNASLIKRETFSISFEILTLKEILFDIDKFSVKELTELIIFILFFFKE